MNDLKMLIYYAVLFYVCLPGLYFDASRILYETLEVTVNRDIAHAVVFAVLVKLTHKKVWQLLH